MDMRYFSFFLLLAAALLAGCTAIDYKAGSYSQPSSDVIFTASFEGSIHTRTFLNDEGKQRWNTDDRVSIFVGNTLNQQFSFDGTTGDDSGTFSCVSSAISGAGRDISANYAVYPYNSVNEISETGVITLNLPATQQYAENSFGVGANTSVAVTSSKNDMFLKFKNVCGFVKLQLYGDATIKSIVLRGNTGEKIAGAAVVTPLFDGVPVTEVRGNGTETITLDCGSGVRLSSTASKATAFYIVVPPVEFENGFTVTITDAAGKVMEKSTLKKIEILRNIITPMDAFEYEGKENISISLNRTHVKLGEGQATHLYLTVKGGNAPDPVWSINDSGFQLYDGSYNVHGAADVPYVSKYSVIVAHNFALYSSDKAVVTVKVGDAEAKCEIEGEYLVRKQPAFVDLGLSAEWAESNLDAGYAEQAGGYYAWGEEYAAGRPWVENGDRIQAFNEKYHDYFYTWDNLNVKRLYCWENYRYAEGSKDELFGLTKYNPMTMYGHNGFSDNLVYLNELNDIDEDAEEDDDPAQQNAYQYTPTVDQWMELVSKCDWEYVEDYNGTKVSGYRVVSRVEGFTDKFIFLPATGFRDGHGLYEQASLFYWANSIDEDEPTYAKMLRLDPHRTPNMLGRKLRYMGLCVRPVRRVPVKFISLNATEVSLRRGETFKLAPSFFPTSATRKEHFFFSTDTKIANITEDGLVTAQSAGTVWVWCVSRDGFTSYCPGCNPPSDTPCVSCKITVGN